MMDVQPIAPRNRNEQQSSDVVLDGTNQCETPLLVDNLLPAGDAGSQRIHGLQIPPPNGTNGRIDEEAAGSAPADTSRDGTVAKSQATRLVQLFVGPTVDLFHSADETAYVTFPVAAHRETWPIRSDVFKSILARTYYRAEGAVLSAQALNDALTVLEGKARFEGPVLPIYLRVAYLGDAIYIDLADDTWRAVEVTASGWRVIENPPVRFRRSRSMAALPVPVSGGSLTELRQYVNLASDDDALLIAAWLVAALQPQGPYPVLVFHGPQGSAKSTTARVLRSLIDPSTSPLRAEPGNARDLMVSASSSWCPAYDNLSHVPQWLSDALCRLSTGGGFATRALYTDAEEMIFDAMRPVILTGIAEVVTSADLLDRSLVLYLPTIGDTQRQPEREYWDAFTTAQPRIFGALLDGVSSVLRERPYVKLRSLPRMADFAVTAIAAMPAFGETGEAFLRAYGDNRCAADDLALEASVISAPLQNLVARHSAWQGTATELLELLAEFAGDDLRRQRSWPKNGRQVAGELRRIVPHLRTAGISVDFPPGRRHGRRIVICTSTPPGSPSSSTSPADSSPASMGTETTDGAESTASSQKAASSPEHGRVEWTEDAGDGEDAQCTVSSAETDPSSRVHVERGHPERCIVCGRGAAMGGPDSAADCAVHAPNPADGERSVHAPSPQERDALRLPDSGTLTLPPVSVVRTAGEFEALLPDILKDVEAAPVVGIDCETTGLDPHTDRLRLIQIATPTRVTIVDCDAVDPTLLRPIFQTATVFALHNAKFDLRFLLASGLPLPDGTRLFDTMIADQVLQAGLAASPRSGFGFADVVARHLRLHLDKSEQMSDWAGTLSSEQLQYAALDAFVLLPLTERLQAELTAFDISRAEVTAADLTTIAALEMRLLPALAQIEHTGLPFDVGTWTALSDAAVRRQVELELQMTALATADGRTDAPSMNWASPLQVAGVLKARGHDLTVRGVDGAPLLTPTGKPKTSTDTDVLRRLTDDPLVDLILEHREATKRAGAYGLQFLKDVNPRTGRIHSQFRQIGTVTGRMSSERPNVQNIPRSPEHRACFRPPEGFVWVKADYSQIEARVTAVVANDAAMLAVFQEGADIHQRTAAALFDIEESKVTREDRQRAKAIVFGFLFGMGAERFVEYARSTYGVSFTLEEARRFRERFFQAFPGIRRWHQQHKGQEGSDTVTLGGRVRRNVQRYTELLNSQVQGTAADGVKLALIRLWEDRASCPTAQIVLTVHDEIDVVCPEADAPEVATWLERHMVDAMATLIPGMPVVVDVSIGQTWATTSTSQTH